MRNSTPCLSHPVIQWSSTECVLDHGSASPHLQGMHPQEFTLSQNHRVIERIGLEGTLKITQFQIPCHGQGYLPLDQVAQSPIQPDLEHFQGWSIHNFSGQPLPLSRHPHHEKFLPYVQSKSTLFQLKTVAPCSVTTGSVLCSAVSEQGMDALVLEESTILFVRGWCLAGSHKLTWPWNLLQTARTLLSPDSGCQRLPTVKQVMSPKTAVFVPFQ